MARTADTCFRHDGEQPEPTGSAPPARTLRAGRYLCSSYWSTRRSRLLPRSRGLKLSVRCSFYLPNERWWLSAPGTSAALPGSVGQSRPDPAVHLSCTAFGRMAVGTGDRRTGRLLAGRGQLTHRYLECPKLATSFNMPIRREIVGILCNEPYGCNCPLRGCQGAGSQVVTVNFLLDQHNMTTCGRIGKNCTQSQPSEFTSVTGRRVPKARGSFHRSWAITLRICQLTDEVIL